MKAVSLFSGVGGLDLGFERAGFKIVAQVEKDSMARAILQRHWPDVKLFEDVKNVGKHNLPAADVIFGGFPCQDVSLAGNRRGLAGERSGLWFEFARIVSEIKPAWVLIENVPGLLSSNGGRDFATVVHGLEKCGYSVGWRVLDSKYFGVPQRRRRVFIIGHSRAECVAKVLFESESVRGDFKAGGTAGEIHTCATESSFNASVAGTLTASGACTARPAGQANEIDMLVYAKQSHGEYKNTGNTSTLTASDDITSGTLVQSKARVRRLTPVETERLQGFPDDWTAGQSDSARYRQMGNAVTVPVATWLAKRIIEYPHPHAKDTT